MLSSDVKGDIEYAPGRSTAISSKSPAYAFLMCTYAIRTTFALADRLQIACTEDTTDHLHVEVISEVVRYIVRGVLDTIRSGRGLHLAAKIVLLSLKLTTLTMLHIAVTKINYVANGLSQEQKVSVIVSVVSKKKISKVTFHTTQEITNS